MRNYMAGASSAQNKCGCIFMASSSRRRPNLRSLQAPHSSGLGSLRRGAEFTHQPGCYDIVRHADAELLAEGESARPALTGRAATADLDGLGIKALKGLCADRGVGVSMSREEHC